jgi:hypothetical protein
LLKTSCTSPGVIPVSSTNPDNMTFYKVVGSTDLYYIQSRLRISCPVFNWFGYNANSSNCSNNTGTMMELVALADRKQFKLVNV